MRDMETSQNEPELDGKTCRIHEDAIVFNNVDLKIPLRACGLA